MAPQSQVNGPCHHPADDHLTGRRCRKRSLTLTNYRPACYKKREGTPVKTFFRERVVKPAVTIKPTFMKELVLFTTISIIVLIITIVLVM
jgi:hypothetical protein